MSRDTFEGNRRGLSIVVGRDSPLRTCFAEVWDGGGPGEAELRRRAGAGRDRMPAAEAPGGLVAPYGAVPADVLAQLEDDHELRAGATGVQGLLSK